MSSFTFFVSHRGNLQQRGPRDLDMVHLGVPPQSFFSKCSFSSFHVHIFEVPKCRVRPPSTRVVVVFLRARRANYMKLIPTTCGDRLVIDVFQIHVGLSSIRVLHGSTETKGGGVVQVRQCSTPLGGCVHPPFCPLQVNRD